MVEMDAATAGAAWWMRPARVEDAEALCALWQRCGLHLPAEPVAVEVARKLERDPDLFLVIERAGRVIASAMGSYDSRRGWINRLAVAPEQRGQRLGAHLLAEVERRLRAKGCPTLNLLIERDNVAEQRYYERLGYAADDLIFMEKWL